MASLAQLQEVTDRNRPKSDNVNQGLMQHAVVKKNTGVELHGQSANEHSYAPRDGRKGGPQKIQTHNSSTIVEENAGNIDALQHQTEVLREQGVAAQKQTGILDKQSGLMQDQISATKGVSDVVNRLYQYMKNENTKPVPKIQNYSQGGGGNTYEGEFSRVPNADGGNSLLDDINMRRERARRQPRDARGRFKKKGWKLPKAGKMLKIGGGIGGAFMAADGMNDIANNAGNDLFDGGFSSRGSGYAQSIGGGAMTGAMIGSIVPVIGTAVGAAVGAALGGLGALLVDNKDAISSGYNSLMGVPGGSRGTGRSAAVSSDIADAAMTKGLGSVSASFESGGKGVDAVSTGKGDNGGVSYGTHQLSSKTGSMTAFLRSEQGSKYYNEFRGMQPGSKEFSEKYKEIAKNDSKGFEEAQSAYITKTHYAPVAANFKEKYGVDPEERSRALKEAMYSVGVQYGAGGAKKLTDEAWEGTDVSKADDAELIKKLQDYRSASVASKFKSSSGAVQQSVANRAKDENVALQKMLANERAGKSGSGIGSVYSDKMIKEIKHEDGAGTVGIMAMPKKDGVETQKSAGPVGVMSLTGNKQPTTMQQAVVAEQVKSIAAPVKPEPPKAARTAAEVATIAPAPAVIPTNVPASNDDADERYARSILDQAAKEKTAQQNMPVPKFMPKNNSVSTQSAAQSQGTYGQYVQPQVVQMPTSARPVAVNADVYNGDVQTPQQNDRSDYYHKRAELYRSQSTTPTMPQSRQSQQSQQSQPAPQSRTERMAREAASAVTNPIGNVLGNAVRINPVTVSGGLGSGMKINKPSLSMANPKDMLGQVMGSLGGSANGMANQGISGVLNPINDVLQSPQRAISSGIGDLLSGKNPFASEPMRPSIAPMVSPESPASASYYANETPITTKASAAPTQTMAMPVATQAAPEKVVRQPFDSVQKVAIADAGAMDSGGSMPAPTGGGSPTGGGGGQKNDTPQLDEIPAIMDDLGLIFINSGYV